MDRILYKSANTCFWCFFLMVPFFIWMYSVTYELGRRTNRRDSIGLTLQILTIGYALVYLPIGLYWMLSGNMSMDEIKPFHYMAMACTFISIVLTARSISRFERLKGLKRNNEVRLFFKIWCYPLGIWTVQPILNEYA